MPDLTIAHEFDCDEQTWWEKCFLSDDFNRRLYVERLRFPEWKVVEQRDEGNHLVRRVEIVPSVDNLPAPLRKVMGDRFSYAEVGTYDRSRQRYAFRVVPSALGDKLKVEGEIHCETLGESKIRRIVRLHIEAKIFGIGGMIEQRTAQDTKLAYDKAAEFTRAFLATLA